MSNANVQAMRPPILAAFRYFTDLSADTNPITAVVRALGRWHRRSRHQTRIHELNDHMLSDIGLSRAAIGQGPAESFWRAHDGGCDPVM